MSHSLIFQFYSKKYKNNLIIKLSDVDNLMLEQKNNIIIYELKVKSSKIIKFGKI